MTTRFAYLKSITQTPTLKLLSLSVAKQETTTVMLEHFFPIPPLPIKQTINEPGSLQRAILSHIFHISYRPISTIRHFVSKTDMYSKKLY